MILQDAIGFDRISLIFAGCYRIFNILIDFARWCNILQELTMFYQSLQDVASFCNILDAELYTPIHSRGVYCKGISKLPGSFREDWELEHVRNRWNY